jgi:hypothetical protein
MTMTVKEAYKVGFARRLAELGYSPSEFETAWFEKEAVRGAAKALGGDIRGLTGFTLGALAALPWFAGAFGGYALGGGKEVSEADVDYLRQRSLIDEYAYAIERLKRQREQEKLEAEGAMQLPKAAAQQVGPVPQPPAPRPITVPGQSAQNIQNVKSILMQPRPGVNQPKPKTMPQRKTLGQSLQSKGIASTV